MHPSLPETIWPALAERFESTAIISLSASGKTARAFNDAVLNARQIPPQAFVAITSNPDSLALPIPVGSTVEVKVLSYAAALDGSTLPDFVKSLSNPPCSNIIIVDFGARDNSLSPLLALLRSSLPLPISKNITVIGIGAEPLPVSEYSPEKAMEGMAAVPERVQMNTSVVREQAIGAIGAGAYFEGVEEGWKGFCERGGCEGVEVEVGKGIEAFGKGWERVCEGEVGGGEAFVL